MRFFAYSITGFIVLCCVSSCATRGDLAELRQSMDAQNAGIESRLYSIEMRLATVDSLVNEQLSISRSLRATLGSQSQEQRDNIGLLAARQDEINYQLRQLLEKLQIIQLYGGAETAPDAGEQTPETSSSQASRPPAQATQPAQQPEAPSVDPQQLYDTALSDIKNQQYALAESRFLSFLMQFPKHDLAANAQYWLGEAVYGRERYDLAVKEFEKVIEKYPESSKVPAAMLKIGYAQYELDRPQEATATLNALIEKYPDTDEAGLARSRLNAPGQP